MISTLTSVHLTGTFTESDSLVWRQSNEALDYNLAYPINWPIYVGPGNGDWRWDEQAGEFIYDPGNGEYILPFPNYPVFAEVVIHEPEPPLAINEVQMTSSTRETTMADHGRTVYTKQSSVDTDWKTANMYNVEQQKIVGFSGTETGRITSEESTLVDTVGMTMTTLEGEVWQCPLCAYTGECLPPFCNIVEMGSSLDMREVQFTTRIESRSIADVAVDEEPNIRITLPIVDGPPTELNYEIGVNGITPVSPARGSVAAYIRVHAIEGSDQCATPCGGPRLDLIYQEKTTASGDVQIFQKNMYYESGIKRDI
ncbi:MAG: hypothetical protein MUC66_08785 [Methanolinea sp.]|nr:hypothetical protein [Methanolinea sp.]